jgi:hypothetical protein
MSADVASTILADEGFADALDAIAVLSLLEDLPLIDPEQLLPARVDWNHALLCASALAQVGTERAVDTALRVAQGCFIKGLAGREHRQAAAILLERMGNRRAVGLAERREVLERDAWTHAPGPLQLDVIRRRLELGIPLSSGERFAGNEFQRDFWTMAGEHGWLSVSAPTSAGKSYIVKRWFEARAHDAKRFSGVYLVPTRALIDEVSRDLRRDFGADVAIIVIPWDRDIGRHPKEIYVVTQERLHVLQERDGAFAPELLFIDEAQKVGDDARGVLLQTVLDEAVRRRPDTQVLFASPSSLNPELLLDGAPPTARPASIVSEAVTVNQNLLWVDPIPRDNRWSVDLVVDGKPRRVGTVSLGSQISARHRLPLVAASLGGMTAGNVVYVNGAADAEKAAEVIARELEHRVDLSDDEEIVALQDLIATTVHQEYRLRPVLRRGVAFHYGNMPLIVRSEIERLFRAEKIRYLVCTSTLLEGVNLPCRNLFARAPKRGNNRPMSIPDFWNLAGRAGRWGTEFRGNVVCVDTHSGWETVPRRRERQRLERASDHVLTRPTALREFIDAPDPASAASEDPLSASVFSLLATRLQQGRSLTSIAGVTLNAAEAERLEEHIRRALEPVEIPAEMIARHVGVSPTAMQVLLNYFRGHQDPTTLPLALPGARGSRLSYTKALSRCRDYLGTKTFGSDMRCAMLGLLVRDWMRGYPLARIIDERIRFLRDERKDPKYDRDTTIRSAMDDVEQIARFAAPKYLACYHDIYSIYLGQRDEIPAIQTEALTMMLELGVSRPTAVSLMGLGLSRTSAVALSPLIGPEDLTPEQALTWLRGADVDLLDVPALVRKEVHEILEIAQRPEDIA